MEIKVLMITMMTITLVMIVMIIMMINNDDSNENANYDNDDLTITIFQTMHFKEPVISEKPKFLALTHVSVCMVIDVVRLQYYQPAMLL